MKKTTPWLVRSHRNEPHLLNAGPEEPLFRPINYLPTSRTQLQLGKRAIASIAYRFASNCANIGVEIE